MGTGQTKVKRYNRHLCNLIERAGATPSFIVSHELSLDEAPEAYERFDAREAGWTKVVLRPAQQPVSTRATRASPTGKSGTATRHTRERHRAHAGHSVKDA